MLPEPSILKLSMKGRELKTISRHHNRKTKLKKANIKPVPIDRDEVDIRIIDLVLKALYHNSHIDTLHIENDIYKRANLEVPFIEAERLWEVMLNSGLVNPVAGFGNAGKLKLSRTGYQLMAQYGSYIEYMNVLKSKNSPPPIAKTETEEDSDCADLTEEDETRIDEDVPKQTPKSE